MARHVQQAPGQFSTWTVDAKQAVWTDLEKQGLTGCHALMLCGDRGRESVGQAKVCRRIVQPALFHGLAVLANAQLVQQQSGLISGRLPWRTCPRWKSICRSHDHATNHEKMPPMQRC